MSKRDPMDNKQDEAELWRDLLALEDGSLAPERREALMERLAQSPADRRSYFDFFQQSAILKMEGAKLHERGLLPVVDSNIRQRRLFQRSMLAAAAVLALSGIVFALITVSQPKPALLKVAVAADTKWTVNGKTRGGGKNALEVREGSTVQVMSGTARLELESGALMVIQGPAHASFPSLNRPVLRQGWLWIETAESGESFEVTTPEVIVRDIGTRFGVRVPSKGPAEVHVLDGEVEVLTKDRKRVVASLKPDGRGYEIGERSKSTELALAPDPFPGLPKLLEGTRSYPTTVRSQAPVRYWKFDAAARGDSPQVLRGDKGVGSRGLFAGFAEGNRGYRLLGETERSVVAGLGGPSGVSRKEGAVGFWIRREPGIESEEVLWLAGVHSTQEQIWPEQCLLYTSLTPSGRVQFFIENDEADVQLSSSRSIADGHWHHIVASWGPSSVDLYVDGWRSASDQDPRELKEAETRGSYVRFGKPSRDLFEEGARQFIGWVDELALWNRPLTHAEVTHQFQSAKASTKD